MNKYIKTVLVIINLVMLALPILWYSDREKYEPIFAILGQIAALLLLLFEKPLSKVFTKNIDTSKIRIEKGEGDTIHTENVKNSDIEIR